MTTEEIKAGLETLADGIDFAAANVSPSSLEAAASSLAVAGWTNLSDGCFKLRNAIASGNLAHAGELLRRLRDRNMLLWLASRMSVGEASFAVSRQRAFEDGLKQVVDSVDTTLLVDNGSRMEIQKLLDMPFGLRRAIVLRRFRAHVAAAIDESGSPPEMFNWNSIDWVFWAKVILKIAMLLIPFLMAEEKEGAD